MQRRRETATTDILFYSSSHETSWHYQELDNITPQTQPSVPLSIFSGTLPALRATVKYLRDHEITSFSEIARLLGRAESTIRVTYANTKEDVVIEDGLRMPLSAFDLALSPLETVVFWLRNKGYRNAEVASLLSMDARTSATIYARAKKKGVVADA